MAVEEWKALVKLPEDTRNTLCRWLSLGIIDPLDGIVDSGYVTLDGSLLVSGKISHELSSLGIGIRIGNGILLQNFFHWSMAIGEVCPTIELSEDVKPMGMRILGFAPFTYVEHGGPIDGFVEFIKSYGRYIGGKFVEAMYRVWGLGGVMFDEQVDLVIIAGDELIAHHLIDIRRTEHRGFTSSAKYLQYGFDRVVLMHPYVDDRVHSDIAKAILMRSDISSIGYLAIMYDEYEIMNILMYKWPMINRLPLTSRVVAERNMAIKRVLRYR